MMQLILAVALALRCLTLTLPSAQVERVIDGDTFVVYSIGVTNDEHLRVMGVNAWETSDPRGPAATEFTKAWLARGPFTISSCLRDHFGRLLVWVTRGSDSLNVALIGNGHGVRMP